MIKAKARVISGGWMYFEKNLNEFLSSIDIRQIVRIQYAATPDSNNNTNSSCIVFYVDFEDIREAKLENILEVKD